MINSSGQTDDSPCASCSDALRRAGHHLCGSPANDTQAGSSHEDMAKSNLGTASKELAYSVHQHR